ncbi:hypothetical protein BJ508DRAFT_321031 [Ascobolus immersus RN42]|uniref:CNH domain-containing protein n=1 Tax=Ascobolus immersus RN42 TaxID=1160509 RepID=A0A3N4IQW1_ASCIM|nr:hypothetical protein BJ508DRAFT_321031 [Ascobolus immersus RN42]
MIDAFHARPILEFGVKERFKVESLLAYADKLLLGLSNGTLRVYQVKTSESGDIELELLKTVDKFSRRSIELLACIKEAQILVSLSDGHVQLHDLETCTLQQTLVKTRGATTFAVTTNIERDETTGIPSIVSRLAVGVKRKLLLFSWQDEEFIDGKEITLVGNVRHLTWASSRRLVAGLASSFVMVDIIEGTVSDITAPITQTTVAPAEEAKGWGALGMSYMGMGGWGSKPISTKLKGEELLLVKDTTAIFIDETGKPATDKPTAAWPVAPDAIAYSYPYVISLHAGKQHMEIRNPATQTLIQTIPIPGVTILHVPPPGVSLSHAGRLFYVASPTHVYKMGTVDYETQINQLVEAGQLDEAISLLEQLESVLLDSKEERIREIKMLKAEALFKKRKFRDSMGLFAEVSAPPERAIRLFPESIAGELAAVDEEHTSQNGDSEPAEDSDKTSNLSKEEEADNPENIDGAPEEGEGTGEANEELRKSEDGKDQEPAPEGKEIDAVPTIMEDEPLGDIHKQVIAPNPAKKSVDTMSIFSGRSKITLTSEATRDVAIDNKPLEGNEFKRAVNELTIFLADTRLRLSKYLEANNPEKQALAGPPTPDTLGADKKDPFDIDYVINNSSTESVESQYEKALATARLVDTTLFRAYILTKPAMVGPLVRRPNHCDPNVIGKELEKQGKFNDLVDFYGGKGLHKDALKLLKQFGQAEEEDERAPLLHGPERTIAYLQTLDASQIDLILEYAKWVLEASPDLGMEVFLADTEKAESLPRERVLEFLQNASKVLAIRYLEHVIHDLEDASPAFHNRLAWLYISHIQDKRDAPEDQEEWKEKLLDFLKESKQYRPERVLTDLSPDDPDFYEPRAVVLSHMGQHKRALEIYVFKIKDHDKAESYCAMIHEQTPPAPEAEELAETPSQVYHILLELYLTPPSSHKRQIGPALALLSRHGARLDASKALAMIPEDTRIKELESYFERRTRHANSKVSEAMVTAQLLRSNLVKVQHNWSEKKKKFSVVSEETVCPVCHKRLGKSVISVLPGGTTVHYDCGRGKRNTSKVSQWNR